jgi:hypothetical protein
MKVRSILLLALVAIVFQSMAQVQSDKYYVQFTDKDNSPYSLNNPEEFLTQRAIDRRINQGISYDMRDLPVNPQYLDGVAATGAQILYPTKWMNGTTIKAIDASVIDAVEALPYVSSVTLVTFVSSNNSGSNTEKSFFTNEIFSKVKDEKGLKNVSNIESFDFGDAYNQINLINGIPLHDAGYRGEGMVIAVLDAGFSQVDTDLLFDSLRNDGRILGTKDFVYPGGNVYQKHYHGRMVLSTMAANIPGLMIGTAPKASYWLLRSENPEQEYVAEEYNWVSAAEFADSVGVDVINSSLGYTVFDDPSQNHTYADMNGNTTVVSRGADIAAAKGILVVNSAGNSGDEAWFYVGAPADGDSVFTIGASDNLGNYVYFSSKGPTSDGRIKPSVTATGSGTTVSDGYDGITHGNGTSFSSPIIAGMSACLWQAMPEMSNMEIQDALMQSASQNNNPDSLMGWGIPDYEKAWWLLTSIDSNEGKTGNLADIYPNPFSDYVYLKFSDRYSGSVNIIVYNIMGEVVLSQSISAPSYKLSFNAFADKMPSGFYVIQLSADEKVQTVKLVKQ